MPPQGGCRSATRRAAARDLAARKITVNVLQPGSIESDMNPASGAFAEPKRH